MFVVLLVVGGFGGERRPSGAFVSNQGNKSVADHKKIFFFFLVQTCNRSFSGHH